jgi:hypothetical protein
MFSLLFQVLLFLQFTVARGLSFADGGPNQLVAGTPMTLKIDNDLTCANSSDVEFNDFDVYLAADKLTGLDGHPGAMCTL